MTVPIVPGRDIRIKVTVESDTRGGDEAAKSLEKVSHAADGTDSSMRRLSVDTDKLNKDIEVSRQRIRELGAEFQRTGDKSFLGDLRKERSQLRELQRLAREAADVLVPGDDHRSRISLPKLDFSNLVGESRGVLIAGLIGVAAVASPAIGAMVAGAVAGTVAGGGIAGGVVAAMHDARVVQAWSDFTAQMTHSAFGSGELAGPMIKAIETLKSTFHDIDLGATFAKGAPALQELTEGISGFVTNLMPGFNAVMDDSEAIMSVFGDGLADTGDALTDMLVDIVSSRGTLEGLHFLFIVLNGSIRAVGNSLQWLGDRFHDLAVRGAPLTGTLEDVFHWARLASPGFEFLEHAFASMNDNLEDILSTAPLMASGMTGVADATGGAGKAFGQSAAEMEKMAEALKKVNEQLYTAQGFMLDADDAVDRINQDMLHLAQSVEDNGTSLDDHTEIGIKNRQMLRGLIQDLRDQYTANINAGMSATDASAAYSAQANALQNTAVQMGFAADQVAALIGMYKQIPPRIDIDIMQHYYTTGTPIGENSGQRFSETYGAGPNGFQVRAAGGPVSPFGTYVVGEHGPELLQMGPSSGYVFPNARTAGGGVHTINLLVNGRMLRQLAIDDAIGRGVQSSTISVAYP